MGMKLKLLLVAFTSAALAVGCSKKSSSGGSSTSSTWTMSGTMSGLGTSSTGTMSVSSKMQYLAAEVIHKTGAGFGDGQVSALSNQCANGMYYQVLCASWSVPPVAAYGDVACGGQASGSFSVAGLPKDTEISCFVKSSSDGATYNLAGTIEFTSTDGLQTSGDMNVSVALGTDGTLTATITSGTNSAGEAGATSTDETVLNGIYQLSCDATTDPTLAAKCKCFMAQENVVKTKYPSSGNGGGDASKRLCVQDSASLITANEAQMLVDINLYDFGVDTNITNDHGDVELATGKTYQAVTVWAANCDSTPCTSTRGNGSAGEGFGNMGNHLTFSGANATVASTAISWSSGAQSNAVSDSSCTGTSNDCGINLGTVPANTATRADWLAWFKGIVAAATWGCKTPNGTGGTTTITDGTKADDKFCVGQFNHQVYERLREKFSLLVPRINFDPCAANSCNWSPTGAPSVTPTAAMINVEGLEFDGSGNVLSRSMGATPGQRFVSELWRPSPSGDGGGFVQRHPDRRWMSCLSSGTDSENGVTGCPSDAGGVECFMNEEMSIKMKSAGSGIFNMQFTNTKAVMFGKIRGGADNDKSVAANGFDATAKCLSVYATKVGGDMFYAKATKK